MSRTLDAIRKALRMGGSEPQLTSDMPLSVVVALLREHGLRLAVVNAERPALQLSAQWLLRRAMDRALREGEPERGLVARLARLVDRSMPRITRAIAGDADLDDVAREALEQHLLDPKKHPLPPYIKPPGRPKGS
jgi:hypothetical protein